MPLFCMYGQQQCTIARGFYSKNLTTMLTQGDMTDIHEWATVQMTSQVLSAWLVYHFMPRVQLMFLLDIELTACSWEWIENKRKKSTKCRVLEGCWVLLLWQLLITKINDHTSSKSLKSNIEWKVHKRTRQGVSAKLESYIY